jgi:peptide-methionine (S)-S-oxide reductase
MKKNLILAGGCYWCVEAIFKKIPGVLQVRPGYYHLDKKNFGFTDRDKVEVIYFQYDDEIVNFDFILDIFFFVHTATLVKWDINDCFYPLCRSAIIYFDIAQKTQSQKRIDLMTEEKTYEEPIQTKLIKADADNFTLAPDKEQDYYLKYPNDGYCTSIIAPKIKKLYDQYGIK